jgi:hypothetical protein
MVVLELEPGTQNPNRLFPHGWPKSIFHPKKKPQKTPEKNPKTAAQLWQQTFEADQQPAIQNGLLVAEVLGVG